MTDRAPDRAIVFVDGNNWYHGLRTIGETNTKRLNYAKVAAKLLGPRTWVATRYYVGKVEQTGNPQLYADQRSFVDRLLKTDPRITVHYGRVEKRPTDNPLADELMSYLGDLKTPIDRVVRQRLESMAKLYKKVPTYVEKAADVFLAVDLVGKALTDEYDAAYILSADGDYTPAVEIVRARGKKVYAVSAQPGDKLAKVVNTFIRIESPWLVSCYD